MNSSENVSQKASKLQSKLPQKGDQKEQNQRNQSKQTTDRNSKSFAEAKQRPRLTSTQPKASQSKESKKQPCQKQATESARNELDSKVNKLSNQSESCKQQISSNLEAFAKQAQEMKVNIGNALERQQITSLNVGERASEVELLRERLVELTKLPIEEQEQPDHKQRAKTETAQSDIDGNEQHQTNCTNNSADHTVNKSEVGGESLKENQITEQQLECCNPKEPAKEDKVLIAELSEAPSGCFEFLSSRLDPKTKFVALKSSLEKHFKCTPGLLEPICNKLIDMSRQIDQLRDLNDHHEREAQKLRLIKEKLSDLCRELQRSNNQIRIESLDLIKTEQSKAKEQADKIQSTLAGVMKLFNDNQQRNASLKQENFDLQTKLRGLLEHCGNWEQCVATAMKQRDVENKLLKTELTRLALVKTEAEEKFFKEKADLLRALESMRTHQSQIESKEAKLRSDLTNYVSKYDECQGIIHDGLGKFQVESKRMLKQIENSRQDYVTLLNKYEKSNNRIKALLEEKQTWAISMSQANKKVETLEKLCRALKKESNKLVSEHKSTNLTEADGESKTINTTINSIDKNDCSFTPSSEMSQSVLTKAACKIP